MSAFITFNIALMDRATGKAVGATGGKVFVANNGLSTKAALYDPDNNFAALGNPIAITQGTARFAVASGTGGQISQPMVDIYGMGPGGQCFVFKDAKPGDPTEIWIDSNEREQILTLPFAASDSTAAAETDTGFDMPVGARLRPIPALRVTVLDATETIDVGLLSSESGGDANGILAAASVAVAGGVAATLTGTPTLGALLSGVSQATSTLVPQEKVISTATSVTYTLTAGSDTAAGLIEIPFVCPSA